MSTRRARGRRRWGGGGGGDTKAERLYRELLLWPMAEEGERQGTVRPRPPPPRACGPPGPAGPFPAGG